MKTGPSGLLGPGLLSIYCFVALQVYRFTRPLRRGLWACAAGEDVEEVDDILVFGEDAVVVEVDVLAAQGSIAGSGVAAGEDIEEVDDILVFGEDAVVIEVDGVAGWRADGGGGDDFDEADLERGGDAVGLVGGLIEDFHLFDVTEQVGSGDGGEAQAGDAGEDGAAGEDEVSWGVAAHLLPLFDGAGHERAGHGAEQKTRHVDVFRRQHVYRERVLAK